MSQNNASVANVHVMPTARTAQHDERLESNTQLQGLREKGIVAYEKGVLYVATAYLFDSGLESFLAYCKRQGIRIEKEAVSVEDINRINSSFVKTNTDSKDSQAIQTFHEITGNAVQVKASDIHIIIRGKSTTIKQRVNGDLMLMPSGSLTSEDGRSLCTAIYQSLTDAADPHYTPTRQQDARIPSANLHSSLMEKVSGIRVATSPIQNGSLMVLRLLYETGFDDARGLTDLGYKPDQVAVIENMKRNSTGINLVVGPTGSGKSTTLKMILSEIGRDFDERIHILTVEDPPEYPIPGVNQIPVTNAENTEERHGAFNAVVRGSMRLDPDCIMIGEVRDPVTADLALNAAMTGHRVWTTLHANTALGAIQRLAVLGVDVNLLAESSVFRGVISQRLIKTLCPSCRVPYSAIHENPDLYKNLLASGINNRIQQIIKGRVDNIHLTGKGCDKCNHTGTKGRTVIAEIIVPDSKMMGLILQKNWIQARQAWLKGGGEPMMMHAIEKIIQGLVDPRAVEDVLDPIHIEQQV